MLSGQRFAVNSRSHQRQLVHRFVHAQTFVVRPGISLLSLSHRFFRSVEGNKAHVFRRRERRTKLDESCERKAHPGHDHRPGFDTPETINPLLQREFSDEIFETNLERLLHQTSDLDGPRFDRESRGKTLHRGFVGGEFVKVVVATGDTSRSQSSIVNLEFHIARCGVKRIGSAYRQRNVRCSGCVFF